MHDYPHVYNSQRGHHTVGTTGELRMEFIFEARKHARMRLHIGGTFVADIPSTGNLNAKIEHARKLLTSYTCCAGVLQGVVDTAIARRQRNADDARAQVERHEKAAQYLRDLKL